MTPSSSRTLVGGVEQPGGAADELGGLPAEDVLDAVVGEDDPAVFQPDHGMRDGIQDRCLEGLQLRQLGPGLDLPGDVHGVAEDGPLSAVVDGGDRLGDPKRKIPPAQREPAPEDTGVRVRNIKLET